MRLFTLIALMVVAPVAFGQGYLNQTHPDTGEPIPFARSEYSETHETRGDSGQGLQLLAHIPDGSTKRVHFLDDDTYIFQNGTAVVIATLNGDNEFEELSRATVDWLISDIVVQGDVAYVASATEGGLALFDISDYSNISFLGENDGYNALAVAVEGNYAYVGRATAGVRVYDVSDPENPTVIADIPPTGGSANGLHVQDDVLYVANGNPATEARVRFYDVSDPTAPVDIGGVHDLEGFVTYMIRDGDILYVNGAVGVAAVDVSDLDNPIVLDTHTDPSGNTFRSGVVGDRLIVAGVGGFYLFDVSDPSNLDLIEHYPDGQGLGAAISPDGSQALYADRLRALHLFDIGSDEITEIAVYRNGGFAAIPYFHENHLYVVDLAGGFIILEVGSTTDPSSIDVEWVGRYDSHPNSQYLEISGTIGVLTNSDFGLMGIEIVDFTDPANPAQLAYLPTDFQPYGMDFVDDVLFVAAGFGGIASFDISDPENPQLISNLPFGSNIYDLIVIDDVAYLSSFGGGGISVDISDPENMIQLFTDPSWGFLQGVAQVPYEDTNFPDRLIAYSDGQHGLRIVDISDPENLVSDLPVAGSGQARDVAVDWNGGINARGVNFHMAYTAADFYGLNVYGSGSGFEHIDGFRSSDRGIGVDVWRNDTHVRNVIALATGEGGIYLFSTFYPYGNTEGDTGANTLTLNSPYPNPSISTITFSFDLQVTEDIELAVFDVLGRRVATVASGMHNSGSHEVRFNTGSVAAGTYLVRLVADGQTATQSFTVIR